MSANPQNLASKNTINWLLEKIPNAEILIVSDKGEPQKIEESDIKESKRKQIIEMIKIIQSMLTYIDKLDEELTDVYLTSVEKEIKADKRNFMSELCTNMCKSIIEKYVAPSKAQIESYKKNSSVNMGHVLYREMGLFHCRAENLLNSLNKTAPETEIRWKFEH